MARHLIALAVLGFAVAGCVSQEKYNALRLEKDTLVEQLNKAQAAEAAARAAADAWKNQLDSVLAAQADANKRAGLLADENAALKAQFASMQAKYEDLLNRPAAVVQMSPELKNALADLARQYPDLVELDEARGILKFKSDVTFAKGSAELTPKAKEVIAQLTKILNSPVAKDYELMVAGHTDNTPVRNSATVSAGHKDNWYLSAHRAISVGHEMIGDGVSPRRLGVAGYGDQRPVASNATPEGQAKNRRVEVAIMPTTYRGPAVSGG
ncbi:MAG TPA: OmpA family protein, partial [Tepidisphaeraceae bacterium]|nr:OmpA family protein [Tepidisphaeraceae bacterium]